MITLTDYFMGRDKKYAHELTDEITNNAMTTVAKANLLIARFKDSTKDTEFRKVTSGWRPPEVNANTPNSAVRSKHMTGQAVDIADPEGDLDQWVLDNPHVLEQLGLWQEDPGSTKGWMHIQIVPPKSLRRVFYP